MTTETPSQPSSAKWLTISQVCDRLDLSPTRVHRLIEDHALIATRVDGQLQVPAVFLTDQGPLPHLAGTVTLLLDGGFSKDEALAWLLEPLEELDTTPADALAKGFKTRVRRIAQALAI